jgi:aldehyde dehydrogenase (NAD+)
MPVAPADIAALPQPGFLIGGRRLTEGRIAHDHRYPATGQVTRTVPLASADEIDEAVKAARAALPAWRGMPVNERRKLMLKFAEVVRRHNDDLLRLITAENGTAQVQTQRLPTVVAELFEYNAGWADKIGGEVVTTWPVPAFDYTLEEPYGVIGVIVPWNVPFVSFGQLLAPAIAAGNTTVIKPPEFAPYTCLRLGELALEAGIPPGVINVVPAGAEGGDALARHPGVDKLHFTGSGATGRKVLTAAATNLTPVGLELGGKSARLVFADADRASAVRNALGAAIGMSGQACIAGSRVLVEASIYESFVADCQAALEAIKVGDPVAPGTVMGPVISQLACDRILGFVDRARDAGVRLVTGGARLGGELADGYFIAPTLFADVDTEAEIARHEIFGPVISMIPFKDEEDAVRIANDTEFGLAAYVESENVKRAHRLAAALESGTVWVNGLFDLPAPAPFGGNKRSGVGRVGGIYGIREFTRPKNVYLRL